MNKIIIYLAISLFLLITKTFAQTNETFEIRAKKIAENIETITKTEKEALKIEIENINYQLAKNEINFDQAMAKKQELANIRAKNIEDKVAIEQQKLNDLIKEKVDGKIAEVGTNSKKKSYTLTFREKDTIIRSEFRSTFQVVFAAGLNNVLTNNSIANSDFRYFGSHFYEFGVTANYKLSKTSNLLHLKYGFSGVWNNLRPSNNREFIVDNIQTGLQTNPIKLEDSRFRNVLLTVPVHLEFDFTPVSDYQGKPFFRSHEKLRFAIGAFAGINLNSTQFSEISINKYFTETETNGDFNTNNFVYGLSSYIGYKQTSLYLKYDLNPIFTSNAVKQNNISVGLRWDLN